MNNNKIGNKCEEIVVDFLRKNHYYVYHIPHKTNGQPVDIIAAKGGSEIFLIDAKHVEKGISFPFSDIQPNQIACFDYAKNYANLRNLGFAISFERSGGELFWFSYDKYLECISLDKKSVKYAELVSFIEVIK